MTKMTKQIKMGLLVVSLLAAVPSVTYAGWFCSFMCDVGGFFVGAGCVAWETAGGLFCIVTELTEPGGATLGELAECVEETWYGYVDCVDEGSTFASDCTEELCE